MIIPGVVWDALRTAVPRSPELAKLLAEWPNASKPAWKRLNFAASRIPRSKAPVFIFVLLHDSLAAFPHQEQALLKEKTHRFQEGRYAIILGVIDKNAVLVIGQAEPERLEKMLAACGTYPDHP